MICLTLPPPCLIPLSHRLTLLPLFFVFVFLFFFCFVKSGMGRCTNGMSNFTSTLSNTFLTPDTFCSFCCCFLLLFLVKWVMGRRTNGMSNCTSTLFLTPLSLLLTFLLFFFFFCVSSWSRGKESYNTSHVWLRIHTLQQPKHNFPPNRPKTRRTLPLTLRNSGCEERKCLTIPTIIYYSELHTLPGLTWLFPFLSVNSTGIQRGESGDEHDQSPAWDERVWPGPKHLLQVTPLRSDPRGTLRPPRPKCPHGTPPSAPHR